MTVTSASWASSAVDHFGSSYAQGSNDKSPEAGAFSRMLNEGIRKDKEESSPKTSAHDTKARRPDAQSTDRTPSKSANEKTPNGKALPDKTPSDRASNDKTENADAGVPQQSAKPAITGKFGLVNQQQTPDDESGQKDLNFKDTVAADPLATNSSLATDVLSGVAVNTNSGSILMAMLMQMRTGSAGLSGHANIKEDSSQNEQDQEPQAGAAQSAIAGFPLPFMAQQMAELNQGGKASTAGAATNAGGVKGSMGGTSVDDAISVDKDESASSPTAMQGHLAFALRLNASLDSLDSQAADTKQQSQIALENLGSMNSSVLAAPSADLNALAAGSEKKDHSNSDSKDQAGTLAVVDVPAPAASPLADTTVPQSQPPAAAQAPEVDDRQLEYSTDPVRNIQMQVVGEDNRRVDIRLMDRSGELRVSVKSGDTALNKSLQGSMPDLTSRLQSAQYQTEVWIPSSASQSQSQGGRTGADGRENQTKQPDWVANLEDASSKNTERIN